MTLGVLASLPSLLLRPDCSGGSKSTLPPAMQPTPGDPSAP